MRNILSGMRQSWHNAKVIWEEREEYGRAASDAALPVMWKHLCSTAKECAIHAGGFITQVCYNAYYGISKFFGKDVNQNASTTTDSEWYLDQLSAHLNVKHLTVKTLVDSTALVYKVGYTAVIDHALTALYEIHSTGAYAALAKNQYTMSENFGCDCSDNDDGYVSLSGLDINDSILNASAA